MMRLSTGTVAISPATWSGPWLSGFAVADTTGFGLLITRGAPRFEDVVERPRDEPPAHRTAVTAGDVLVREHELEQFDEHKFRHGYADR